MRRFFSLSFVAGLTLSLFACGANDDASDGAATVDGEESDLTGAECASYIEAVDKSATEIEIPKNCRKAVCERDTGPNAGTGTWGWSGLHRQCKCSKNFLQFGSPTKYCKLDPNY